MRFRLLGGASVHRMRKCKRLGFVFLLAVMAGWLAPSITHSEIAVSQFAGSAAIEKPEGPNPYNLENTLPSDSMASRLSSLIETQLVPRTPGLLVLLALSILFGSINFLAGIPEKHRSVRKVYKYLFVWVSINYTFALILLLLTLPDDVGWDEIDRTFIMYCVIVTIIPEFSTNLRLQFGKEQDYALDLSQYKIMVSGLISNWMESAAADQRKQALDLIDECYSGSAEHCMNKIALLERDPDLTPEEKKGLMSLTQKLEQAEHLPISAELRHHPRILTKLLDFCSDDIRAFQSRPEGKLLSELQPRIQLDEARVLVSNGITSPQNFVRWCQVPFFMQRLSRKTGIEAERIRSIYFSSRYKYRKKRFTQVAWGAGVFLLFVFLSNLVAWYSFDVAPNVPTQNKVVVEGPFVPLGKSLGTFGAGGPEFPSSAETPGGQP